MRGLAWGPPVATALHGLAGRVHRRMDRYGHETVPGEAIGEALEISRLICPLRYDILVRVDFLRFLRDHRRQYERDPEGFLDHAPVRAYFTWFREVVCARSRPVTYRQEGLLRRRFRDRVRNAAKLWASFERRGLLATRPILLLSGYSIQPVNGKVVASTIFAGDGCHRIACLYLSGLTALEPHHYAIELRRRLEPLDNTAVLIRALPLDRAAYLRFLAGFYGDGAEADSVQALRREAAARRPKLLPELDSVLAHDLPRITAHDERH